MRFARLATVLAGLMGLLALACGGGGEPEPAPTQTAEPSIATPVAPTHTPEPQTAGTSERGIYVVRPDGSGLRGPLVPFDLQAFRWSPDGKRVAIAGICGAITLTVVDVTTGTATEAASLTGDRFLHGLEWAPDSTRVLIGVGPPRVQGAEPEPRTGIFYLTRPDGGGEPEELFRGELPVWSPDGRSIAYIDPATAAPELRVLDVATGESTTLATGVSPDAGPVWSPDGSRLAFLLPAGESQADLAVINADGSGRAALAPAAQSFAVAWIAGGQRLVFLHGGDPDRPAIATVPVAGGPVEILRSGYSFDVSAVANTVAVYDNLQGGRTEIEVFDLATGQSHLVSGDLTPVGDTVALSPDGSRLVFNAQDAATGRRDLYIVNVDGTGLRKLVEPSTAIGARADWSLDGQLIVFNDTVITSCM